MNSLAAAEGDADGFGGCGGGEVGDGADGASAGFDADDVALADAVAGGGVVVEFGPGLPGDGGDGVWGGLEPGQVGEFAAAGGVVGEGG